MIRSTGRVRRSDIGERDRRPERDAWSGIGAAHHRLHVVAAGIEAGYRPIVRNPARGPGIGDQPRRRPDVGRIKPQRIERRRRNRAEVGVGAAGGRIAIVVLVDRAAPAEFEVAPGLRIAIHAVDRFAQIAGIDVQSLRQLLDAVCGGEVSVGDGGPRAPPPGRTMPRPYFRNAAASAIRNAGIADGPCASISSAN